jgi:ERCC4-related helicase
LFRQVVVATGEVVRSALESGQLQAQQLACVVLDEAHYAVGCSTSKSFHLFSSFFHLVELRLAVGSFSASGILHNFLFTGNEFSNVQYYT